MQVEPLEAGEHDEDDVAGAHPRILRRREALAAMPDPPQILPAAACGAGGRIVAMATGRFAPSPTGALHLGSLRTALLAWLFARSAGSRFLLRVEDLDPVTSSPEHEAGQLADLVALGLDWDGPVVRQSERRDAHEAALAELVERGLTYPCFCSRREIREASAAPHAPPGRLPRHVSRR